MRFKLTLEYDGGPYLGWQRAATGPSVQSTLEDAIEKLIQQMRDVGPDQIDTRHRSIK